MTTKNIYFQILFILSTLIVISCGQEMNKEKYLANFKELILEVENNSKNITTSDWDKKQKKYQLYTTKYYSKFKDELSWKDELLIEKYKLQYKLHSVKNISSALIGFLKNQDEEAIRKKIETFMKEGNKEDLNFLIEQAEDIGGDISKTVFDIVSELENKE